MTDLADSDQIDLLKIPLSNNMYTHTSLTVSSIIIAQLSRGFKK